MSKHGPRYVRNNMVKYDTFDKSPGPGSYDLAQPIGKYAPKFSFRPRMIRAKFSESPPPGTYSPVISANTAYKNITFGIGERKYLFSINSVSPGPGAYYL